ncbi:hypothetical protein Fot_06341 [Forsythia ovata]|uniref:Uncharacterized protein n=1 Tax=Forsythia ovata TaxID=205694 RepID=A0ABD1WT32_9LAMI
MKVREILILEQLGYEQEDRDNFERRKWSFPMTVVDDDTKQTLDHLQLMKKEKGRRPFGFYDDWRQKIVKTRNFRGDEEIGFYVDQLRRLRTTRRFIQISALLFGLVQMPALF